MSNHTHAFPSSEDGSDFHRDDNSGSFLSHYVMFKMTTSPCFIILGCVGVVTNILSLVTFVKMKLSDSVTTAFFCLSLFDLGFNIASISSQSCELLGVLDFDISVLTFLDPTVVFIFSSNAAVVFYACSMTLIVWIAVQRCCCVTLPFTFRSTFTVRKTVAIVCFSACFNLCMLIIILSAYGTAWLPVPGANRSSIQLVLKPIRLEFFHFLGMLNCVTTIIGQIIITVCTCILAVCLRRSVQFRKTSSRLNTPSNHDTGLFGKPDDPHFTKLKPSAPRKSLKGHVINFVRGKSSSLKTSPKLQTQMSAPSGEAIDLRGEGSPQQWPSLEKSVPSGNSTRAQLDLSTENKEPSSRTGGRTSNHQLILSITLISALFIISNFPRIAKFTARLINPEFDTFGKLYKMFYVISDVQCFLEIVNASVNFFIYLSVNSKFREAFFVKSSGICS